jgi:hypothetical protein
MPFSLPGNLKDHTDVQKAISKWNKVVTDSLPEKVNLTKRPNFLAETPDNDENETFQVLWLALPKRHMRAFEKADERKEQDEYCEWEVERDANGKLQKVTFTCEFPEVRCIPVIVLFCDITLLSLNDFCSIGKKC